MLSQKLKDCLRKCDIFGQTIALNFKQEEYYTTNFGGFTSICIIALILSFFYSNIIGFLEMSTVFTTTQMTFDQSPENIELTFDRFMFAVQIDQPDFNASPYLNITVEQRHYHRDEDGTQTKYPGRYLDMVPCTLEHFEQIFRKYQHSVSQEYILNNVDNYLCPNMNIQDLKVGGSWSSRDYYFLKITVTKCLNERNDNFTWQPTCKNETEFKKKFASSGNFRIQIITTNFLINPQQPTDYVKPYLASDLFFTFMPEQQFIQADIFMRNQNITTDNGILMYKHKTTKDIPVRNQGDMREQLEINKLIPGKYAAFFLQRSPFSYETSRSFLKLDDLLSYLGGFLQFVVVILGFSVNFYNRQHMMISMANELYELQQKDRKNNIKLHSTDKQLLFQTQQGIEILSSKKPRIQTLENVPNQSPFTNKPVMQQVESVVTYPVIDSRGVSMIIQDTAARKPQKQSTNYLKTKATRYFNKFKEFVDRQQQIGISLKFMFSQLLEIDYFMDENSKLLMKATKQIQSELDIGFILKQMYELAKLKKVLFSKEQTTLFEFSQKPIILLHKSDQQTRAKKLTKSNESNDKEYLIQFNGLINSYRTITALDQHTMTEEQKRFNQRLVVLLGRELVQIIESEIANYESDESHVEEVEDQSPKQKQSIRTHRTLFQ